MNINPLFKDVVHRRLAKWARGKPQPPVLIDLEPFAKCNITCKFCWQRDDYRLKITDYSNPLSDKELLDLIDQAGDMGVCEWNLAGGWEPTYYPDLARKIMKRIRHHGMYGCITTNGTMFTEEWVREMVEVGWDRILFSLTGPDAATHDGLTQMPGSFKRITNSMRMFKHWKEELGLDKPNFSCHSVLCTENYDKVKPMVELAHELGASGMSWEPMNPWSDMGKTIFMSPQQRQDFQRYIQPALETSWFLGIGTNLERFREVELIDKENMDVVLKSDIEGKTKKDSKELSEKDKFLTSPCYAPWLNMEIRASGHAVTCRLCDTHEGAPTFHDHSLKDIWYGPYFGNLRERLKNKNLMQYCHTCASGFVVGFREIREEMQKQSQPLYRIKNAVTDALSPLRNAASMVSNSFIKM